MVTRVYRTTLCETVLFSPCMQRKIWIPIGSTGWLQMQCDTPRIKRWEIPNLMHNVVEKTPKHIWKKSVIRQVIYQALAPSLTHDLKCV